MRKSHFIVLSAILILTNACRKEISFKGDVSDPRLVLQGIVELDSTFKVKLERSVFFLDSSPQTEHAINSGAIVVVKNLNTNESFTLTQSDGDGYYVFPFNVTAGTNYSIEVAHPEYKSIGAEMKTLSGVQIVSLDTSSVMQNSESILKYELKWNDPASEENYYMIQVMATQIWDTETYTFPIFIGSKDAAVDNAQNTDIDGSVGYAEYLLISDQSFNGALKTLRFESQNPFFFGSEQTTLHVELISMTKEVYQYRKSISLFMQQDFFSEPVKIFSNILNGFGIFGFASRDVRGV